MADPDDGARVAASLAAELVGLTFVEQAERAVTALLIETVLTWARGQGWRAYPRARSVLTLPAPYQHRHSLVDVGCARPDGTPVVIEVDHTDRQRSVDKLLAEAAAGRVAIWLRWGSGRFDPPPLPVQLVSCLVTVRRGPAGEGRRYSRQLEPDRPAPTHTVDQIRAEQQLDLFAAVGSAAQPVPSAPATSTPGTAGTAPAGPAAPAPAAAPPGGQAKVGAPAGQPVDIWTDGACSGNPGPGGWGALLRSGSWEQELCGGESTGTTNNRMELMAPIRALESLPGPTVVRLHTDSTYVRDGITRWLPRWKRNGWLTAGRQPVKNVDLWQRLESAAQVHDVQWYWVKGHAGHVENERADRLAAKGRREALD